MLGRCRCDDCDNRVLFERRLRGISANGLNCVTVRTVRGALPRHKPCLTETIVALPTVLASQSTCERNEGWERNGACLLSLTSPPRTAPLFSRGSGSRGPLYGTEESIQNVELVPNILGRHHQTLLQTVPVRGRIRRKEGTIQRLRLWDPDVRQCRPVGG